MYMFKMSYCLSLSCIKREGLFYCNKKILLPMSEIRMRVKLIQDQYFGTLISYFICVPGENFKKEKNHIVYEG